jgi:transposase InsO family protein
MDRKKVEAILDWEEPRNVHDVQVFLGFANFYRRFIKEYSKKAAGLTDLLRKENKKKFPLSERARQSFKDLKRAFTTAPILQHFDESRPCILETDASDGAIAGVISQEGDDGLVHPIAFWSRKMQAAELNYDIGDKEALAMVESIRHWRHYLEGARHPFTVYTDHKNLVGLTDAKVLNRRQGRWATTLAEYDFKIVYRPGRAMGKPDALSRRGEMVEGTRAKDQKKATVIPEGKLERTTFGIAATKKRKRMEVPVERRLEVLKAVHNSQTAGHFGVRKTIELLERDYEWPGHRKMVEDYVKSCEVCNRGKARREKNRGLLQPLPIPGRPWESIGWDFITDLPATSNGNDTILTVVDRFTKEGHFIPCRKDLTAEELADIFLNHIVRIHGLPSNIISDRDKLFTSKFWKSFTSILGIVPKLSTSFHPQTDGQTERLNSIIEQYLRMNVDYLQKDWEEMLALGEMAYNNAVQSSTKFSPWFLNKGFHPRMPNSLELDKEDTPIRAEERLKRLKEVWEEARTNLERAQEEQKKFADRKRRDVEEEAFTEGRRVWLNSRNIQTTRESKKLDHKFFGPFTIKRKVNDTTYELDLPESMRIHPVFHVSLLRPVMENEIEGRTQGEPPAVIVEGEEEFEVEKIVRAKREKGVLKWEVKWKGYGEEDNTWEPWENLKNSKESLDYFYRKRPKAVGHEEWKSLRTAK